VKALQVIAVPFPVIEQKRFESFFGTDLQHLVRRIRFCILLSPSSFWLSRSRVQIEKIYTTSKPGPEGQNAVYKDFIQTCFTEFVVR